MNIFLPSARRARVLLLVGFLLQGIAVAFGTDWPQYRGPNSDGISPDPISRVWRTNSPDFVVWANHTLTNGFSSFAISQNRAFCLISKDDGNGGWLEYCVAVDAGSGMHLWETPIGNAPWDPGVNYNGGDGSAPYYKGDGPRTTPSVATNRVLALSGNLDFVCMNATNGSVLWSNNLIAAYGASVLPWENSASPCVDGDLAFVSLNTSSSRKNLAAFRVNDGGLAWNSQNEGATHATPIVATISGVRQVIFPTRTGLVSLNRATGALLWKFTYPFSAISTSMGASPVVYSNIVFCTASYGRGAAAARVTLNNGAWTATQLYYRTGFNYESIWMTPVYYQGYVYTLCGNNGSFLTPPLNCIELTTGNLKWSTNNFGMGGLILVNTNLLALTEDGQMILVDPNPSAYTEVARFQAFHFDESVPGKCWNSPAFSNGRIYARSTSGAVCLETSIKVQPPLTLKPPQFLSPTQLQVEVAAANGTALDASRVAKIEIRATNNPVADTAIWPRLTNQLVLLTNGLARMTNHIAPGQTSQFYRAVEAP